MFEQILKIITKKIRFADLIAILGDIIQIYSYIFDILIFLAKGTSYR